MVQSSKIEIVRCRRNTAREDWLRLPAPDTLPPPPEWPYVEHDLRIVFPASSRAALVALLGQAM